MQRHTVGPSPQEYQTHRENSVWPVTLGTSLGCLRLRLLSGERGQQ